jgi:hypothetical protein
MSLPASLLHALREEAIANGAIDPCSLTFKVVEYDIDEERVLRTLFTDLSFSDAVERVGQLVAAGTQSHFYLKPTGFVV